MGRPRINGCDEDGKALYEERQFHASLVLDLYHVYCKNCMTTTITNPDHLPHDTATRHRCLYDSKGNDE